MLSLLLKALIGFVFVFGVLLFGVGILVSQLPIDPEARSWVGGIIDIGLIAAAIYWGFVRPNSATKKTMARLNERIAAAETPGDFMAAWAAMAAVMLSDVKKSPLPLTLASVEKIERDFKDVDINTLFPDPEGAMKIVLAVGAFCGELIRSKNGGSWEKEGPLQFSLVLPGAVKIHPLIVAAMFLTKDGDVSLVRYFRTYEAGNAPSIDSTHSAALESIKPLVQQRGGMPPEDERGIALDALIAATVFAAWDHQAHPLPYTRASVQVVERLFLTKPVLCLLKTDAYAQYIGAFLGECIRGELGGTWIYDGEAGLWLLRVNDRLICNPIMKTLKFFTDSDSLDGFYEGSIALANDQGRQDAGSPHH